MTLQRRIWAHGNHMTVVGAAILLLCAAGSIYQAGSGLFYCGNVAAGMELWWWSIAAGLQSLLFVCAGWSSRALRFYRQSQWLSVPILLFLLYQLSAMHARAMLLGGAALVLVTLMMRRFEGPDDDGASSVHLRHLQQGILVLLAWLAIHSALAFLVLFSRTLMLSDTAMWGLMLVSVPLAILVVREGASVPSCKLQDCAPLLLLAMVLLRAKQPDGAYDSLFYKSTLSEMLADWRTARTGLPDHTMLGTNLQEFAVAQLRILDASFHPAFISTLACLALWLLAPLAARAMTAWRPSGEDGRLSGIFNNAATLFMVSLSELLIASGTVYQEPLQVLYLVAGMVAGPAGLLFLAAAAAIKVTALFFIPFLVLLRHPRAAALLELSPQGWPDRLRALRNGSPGTPVPAWGAGRKKLALRLTWGLCAGLALLIFGEQLARNQLLAGRLLAPSETLASITDPQGRMLARVDAEATFDVGKERPLLDSVVGTLIHIGTLDRWMKVEEHGFHVFPSSRLPLAAALFVLMALWGLTRPETRRWSFLVIAYALLFLAFLKFFSQGRHMVAASFAAIALVALLPAPKQLSVAGRVWLSIVLGALAIGDQITGNFINVGWNCERRVSVKARFPTIPPEVEHPTQHDAATLGLLEKRLQSHVADYRRINDGKSRVIPGILCDPMIGRRMYTGAHYVFSVPTHLLIKRYLAAQPERLQRLDQAALVVCATSWGWMGVGENQLAGFDEVEPVGATRIFLSRRLMAGESARQLVPAGFSIPGHHPSRVVANDLARQWKSADLADRSPQQTPTGLGVLDMYFNGAVLPALVADNTLSFRNVELRPDDRIVLDAALPFSRSDGLVMELHADFPGHARKSKRLKLPPPQLETDPRWRSLEIDVPGEWSGPATISVVIHSKGGNVVADWIVIRKLQVLRRPEL